MRRPPLGPIPPGAHDMRREHRCYRGSIENSRWRRAACCSAKTKASSGPSLSSRERRHGFVIRDDIPEEFAAGQTSTGASARRWVDALADLHLVRPDEIGLGDLGRPDGYAARQLDGWTRRWHAAQGGEETKHNAAAMAPVLHWLAAHVPNAGRRGAVAQRLPPRQLPARHGRSRPIAAVLDWDMCTPGRPARRSRLCPELLVEPGDPPEWREIASMPTWREGFPSREEAIQRYARVPASIGAIGWHQSSRRSSSRSSSSRSTSASCAANAGRTLPPLLPPRPRPRRQGTDGDPL